MVMNTGNYRIIRVTSGTSGYREIFSSRDRDETIAQFDTLNQNAGFTYYKEEEVFTTSSLKNESGQSVNSVPYWRKF